MSDWVTNIKRVLSNSFQLFAKGSTGITIKNNSGVLESRNEDDSDYAGFKASAIESSTAKFTSGAGEGKIATSDASGNLVWTDLTSSGNTFIEKIAFTYSTTFPLELHTVGASGADVVDIQIYIDSAFDDNTDFSIGDTSDNNRLATTSDSISSLSNTIFDIHPTPYHYNSGTINLYMPAGTPTTGSGIVTLTLKD
jgi:hypothetical protein